ncbi:MULTISPECIES: hypothetical protein [Burkholderia]|uniref:hypothetical protein n=1 Tax=Burkholderia TaxID=32008 RepID=UPI000B7ACC30|nr:MULTISPECIES: hypothetical protein [Burkholderia]MBY4724455.1 hypothetical protein [Burkholderia contaminans]MCI3967875.1 hypothetical protein [Burkholderia sp. HI4860]MDN7791923.1 hypothetical protein [Burkholderia contaminans]OXI97688.1 hypothetical protein CFB48_19640 [Burkholderia sp. AU33647]
MTFIRPVPAFHVAGRPLRAGAPDNVIPFSPPRPRLQLPVTLTADSGEAAHARLAALLHSPLGVYVVSARAVRDVVHVHFDIAPEDLDFTLHMLIAQQTDAVIGPVARRVRVGPNAR